MLARTADGLVSSTLPGVGRSSPQVRTIGVTVDQVTVVMVAMWAANLYALSEASAVSAVSRGPDAVLLEVGLLVGRAM